TSFQDQDVFERARVSRSHQSERIEGAGKIGAGQFIARLQDVEDTDDPAGLAGMSELNVDTVKERFLLQNRREFFAIDQQDIVFDYRPRPETKILNVDKIEIKTHMLGFLLSRMLNTCGCAIANPVQAPTEAPMPQVPVAQPEQWSDVSTSDSPASFIAGEV